MSGDPYQTSEDSALLRRALRDRSGESCLEIGAGNGGNLVLFGKRFRLVVGTDLIRPSMDDWKGAGADFVLADGASCVRGQAFDLVAFNPPYIPGEIEDRTVDGGEQLEVPKKLLRDALRAVRENGEVAFILNGDAKPNEFQEICTENGFRLRPLISERMFFEELTVYSARAARGSRRRPRR